MFILKPKYMLFIWPITFENINKNFRTNVTLRQICLTECHRVDMEQLQILAKYGQ